MSDDIVQQLAELLQNGDAEAFLRVVGTLAVAAGRDVVAKKAGLGGRAVVHRAFSGDRDPRFTTVLRSLRALGFVLTVKSSEETLASPPDPP